MYAEVKGEQTKNVKFNKTKAQCLSNGVCVHMLLNVCVCVI